MSPLEWKMIRRQVAWLVLLSALVSVDGGAQAPRFAKGVDSIFAGFTRPGVPGCAVGISRNGALEYAKGYGLADLETKTPIGAGTVFNIGSTSKQFVGWAIVLLAEEGKLSLDDPVRRFVPEVPDFGAPITIRHLLNHTSGLRDYASLLSLMGWQGGDRYDEARFLSLIGAQRQLNFPPGTRYLYSNTGYVLLATIVSRASGEPWAQFAERRLFKPLGMTRSSVRTDPFAVETDRALGYSPARGGWRLDMPNHDITGSTAVMTTVEDLARWTGNYWRPTVGDQRALDLMHRRAVLASGDTLTYASGLMVESYRGVPMVDHGGATGGYRAQLLRFPEQKVGIAVLCNAANADPDGRARRVADVVLGRALGPAPVAEAGTAITGSDATLLAGVYADTAAERVIRLVVADGRLAVQAGTSRLPVEALGRDRVRVAGSLLAVERDGAGRVQVLSGRGDDEVGPRYRRIEPTAPDREAMAGYAASYWSPELDRTWWISVKSRGLSLVRRDFGPVLLEPLYGDVFQIPGATVRFVSEGGAVTGIRVSNGRALGVRFERRGQ